MPALRVLAGGSRETLSHVKVNDDLHPLGVRTEHFDGFVTVRIKNYVPPSEPKPDSDPEPETRSDAPYFHQGYGEKVTWSIQLQGRLLSSISADDLVWGNEFDQPIRDKLPYGTSLALKAMSFIDPNLTQDVYSDKPWAFSPLIATMPRMRVDKVPEGQDWPPFPSPLNEGYIEDDVSALLPDTPDTAEMRAKLSAQSTKVPTQTSPPDTTTESWSRAPGAAKTRVSYFSSAKNRQQVTFNPDDLVAADFAHGMVDFGSLTLQLPTFGLAPAWALSFDLKKYWDGRPVYFVARHKGRPGPEGVLLLLQFSLVDE